MIPELGDRLERITAQATESDSTALAYQLTGELSNLPDALPAVDYILRLMEMHPHFDFGCPGPLVHFVETFYRRGYEQRLCTSIRRRPTPHTIWMLNRLINGCDPGSKTVYINLLDEVLGRSDLDIETLARAREFRRLHR
jgi:hypothetical protein